MKIPKYVSVINIASVLYFILLIVFVVSVFIFPISGTAAYGMTALFCVWWMVLGISMCEIVGVLIAALPTVIVVLYGIIKCGAVFYFSK